MSHTNYAQAVLRTSRSTGHGCGEAIKNRDPGLLQGLLRPTQPLGTIRKASRGSAWAAAPGQR